jgi:hypothetical protein
VSRALDDLHPKSKPAFYVLLARATEAGIPLQIVFTGRTEAEQIALYAIGRTDGQPASKQVTWTLDSKHVMSQKQDMKSLAIDICPFEMFQIHGANKLQWDTADPVWEKLGEIGQAAGLKWGVVDSGGKQKDLGHFEFTGPIT